MSRSRGYSVTINNYTDDDIASFMSSEDYFDYGICGFEIGSKCKTPHMQCFIYHHQPVRFKKIKLLFPTAHIEAAKGSAVQGLVYCMKDNHYYEYGERPRQGKRSDLDVIRHDLDNGRTELSIAQDYFPQWCQYRRSFTAYKELIAPKYDTKTKYYDLDQLEELYQLYDPRLDRLFHTLSEDTNLENILHSIYSKKYRYVFITDKTYKAYREVFYGKFSQL